MITYKVCYNNDDKTNRTIVLRLILNLQFSSLETIKINNKNDSSQNVFGRKFQCINASGYKLCK